MVSSSTFRPLPARARPPARPGPAAAALFERQVLVFPLLVVLLACTSFLFGGTCAAWQWWTAVAAVTLVPFARRERWRSALGAAGLFALLLFALRSLLPPIFCDIAECDDMSSCHLPMVQLLIEGWNPIADPTAEGIVAKLGLDLWGMAPLHVAFMPKTLAVFSAVAHSFVEDPRALTFPLPTFLWLGVFLAATRMFRGFPRWALLSALVGVLPMVSWQMPVDLAVAFAVAGLLLTLQDAHRWGASDRLSLVVWSAWTMLVKPTGTLGALAFLTVFAVLAFRREALSRKRLTARFAGFLAVLALLGTLVLWNPLGTSWRTFGHPLYPVQTADTERVPTKDLTWDLSVGNDDSKQMGRAGLLAHAYLSSRATIAFYRWKTGNPDFDPDTRWWSFREFPTPSVRFALAAVFGILLLLKRGRPWGLAGLVLLVSVPRQYIGYTRYLPWLSSMGCLAIALAAEWAEARVTPRFGRALTTFATMSFGFAIVSWGWYHARVMECASTEASTVHERIRPKFTVPQETVRRGNPFGSEGLFHVSQLNYRENQCRLLLKESGRDAVTTFVPAEECVPLEVLAFFRGETMEAESCARAKQQLPPDWGDRTRWPKNPEQDMLLRRKLLWRWTEGWIETPFGYYVPDDEKAAFLHEYNESVGEWTNEPFLKRLRRKAGKVLRAWFATYPREVLKRIRNGEWT